MSTKTGKARPGRRTYSVVPILVAIALLVVGGWAVSTFVLGGGAKNILLMGVDENKTRTDVVVLAHVDPKAGQVNLISLPRDTWVEVPCAGLDPCQSPDKLAHAHVWGGKKGPETTVKTVERFLGVKIDGYVRVDFEGFKHLVDAIGGVDILIDQNMYYHDPTPPELLINFKASDKPQHLDGAQALKYVRFRNDGQGDIGRTERTRRFLKAVLAAVQQKGIVSQVPTLYSTLSPYIATDLDMSTITALARIAPKVDPEKIQMASIPGDPVILKNGPWVWQAKVDETQVLVDTMIKGIKPAAATEEKPGK